MTNTDYRNDADGRILLYRGPMVLEGDNRIAEFDGEVFLSYLPSPTIRFKGSRNEVAEVEPTGEHRLQLPAGRCHSVNVLHTELRIEEGRTHSRISGRVNARVDERTLPPASKVQCLLMNFPAINGRPVDVGHWSGLARISLCDDQWRINVDRATDSNKRLERLKENGGFAWTASAAISRSDNASFSAEDCDRVFETLFFYLSFAAGRWTGFCLPVAYDSAHAAIWDDWMCQWTTPYRNAESWAANDRPECFEQPYGRFCELYADPYWREILVTAIHWYIEANNQAAAIEGSITLTQTALELLAATILVEQENWISSAAFDKLPAGDRLRLLLKWADIPTVIPTELTELTALANQESNQWVDGAHALVEIRNSIIHPTKKNRDRFRRHSHGARVEAWIFGLWMVELVLLRLFGYRGHYLRRTAIGASNRLEQVPWVGGVSAPA
jgi:hypothetical protein